MAKMAQPFLKKYDKQDQQGKAVFNERNHHMIQQQEPVARSPGVPQTSLIFLPYCGWGMQQYILFIPIK
jgi:hypothetical protein